MQNQNKNRHLMPYVTAVMMGITLFFLCLVLFAADPFRKLSPIPIEGQSLNPFCKTTGWHPILLHLYTGILGVTVPFAFAMAALITGRLDVSWIKAIRKWTLFAGYF